MVLLYETLCIIHNYGLQPFSAVQITELAMEQSNPVCIETVKSQYLGTYPTYAVHRIMI